MKKTITVKRKKLVEVEEKVTIYKKGTLLRLKSLRDSQQGHFLIGDLFLVNEEAETPHCVVFCVAKKKAVALYSYTPSNYDLEEVPFSELQKLLTE